MRAQSFLHWLCLPAKFLDEAMVKLLRDHGKCIAIYTCNSDEKIAKALELGADILHARGIVNRFGKQVVHDKFSIGIMRGEIIGIAGGSGLAACRT